MVVIAGRITCRSPQRRLASQTISWSAASAPDAKATLLSSICYMTLSGANEANKEVKESMLIEKKRV